MTSLLVGQLTRLPFHPGYATGYEVMVMRGMVWSSSAVGYEAHGLVK